MFDIGFWEFSVVVILGLIILGPQRLPTALKTISQWISSAKKMANSLKTELSRELEIEKLHEDLKKAEQLNMNQIAPELQQSVDSLKEAADWTNRPYASQSKAGLSEAEPSKSSDQLDSTSTTKQTTDSQISGQSVLNTPIQGIDESSDAKSSDDVK